MQNTDPRRAFEELIDLAPRSVNCMLLLGWVYEKGLGTVADLVQAESWYRCAAEKGSATGCFYLGNLYLSQKAFPQAREALAAGVALGDARSKDALQRLETWQNETDAWALLETDPVRGLELSRRLAENGPVQGMLNLGWAYWKGLGTAADPEQAETWYRRAYDKGSEFAGKSLAHLYYYQGHLDQERKDYARAYDRFTAGAALAYAPAIFRLGRLYARGLGVSQQLDKARSLEPTGHRRPN